MGHGLSTVLTVNLSLYKKLSFDPEKDFREMDRTPVEIIGPEVRERIKADRVEWAKVVAAANMRID